MTHQVDTPDHFGGASQAHWIRLTWIAILSLTVFRILMLALGRTELYLDEEQYWLWGQNPDFGYFSKPPLIGWLIGAVTALSGSDTPFWVRFPAPILHAVTAGILAYWVRSELRRGKESGAADGFWVALAYLTLPIATVGSFVISTDTAMAPFLAGALVTHWRLIRRPTITLAILTGVFIGCAMLAKYAGVYFFLFAGIAALFLPKFRPGWIYIAVAAVSAAVILGPNIYWNLTHDLATLSHTAGNASWVGEGNVDLDPLRFLEFVAGQMIVLGPVFLIVLLWNYFRGLRAFKPELIAFSLPVFLVVGVQSFLADVNPNWTFSACLAATAMAVLWLRNKNASKLLLGAILLNSLLAIALPVATLIPEKIIVNGKPLLARYMGRAKMASQIQSTAKSSNATAILSEDRSLLADLFFYYDAGSGVPVFSTSSDKWIFHYFAQTFPLPTDYQGSTLFITRNDLQLTCGAAKVATFETAGSAYQGRPAPKAYLLTEECLNEVTLHD